MSSKEKCQLHYYSEVTAHEVEWLWYPYIPFGKLTLVQGDPGDGKTTLLLHVASLLSKGAPLPFSNKVLLPSNIIYQSAEDNPGDTIKPRLVRENADCSRIAFLHGSTSMTLLSDEWECAIKRASARLLVIDPFQAYLGGDMHMQQTSDMRQVLRHLGKVAERTHCAIVIIGHMNKAAGEKGLYRGLGSIDIMTAAGSVLLVGRSAEDTNIRVVAQIKNSLAPEGVAFAYELVKDQGIRWIGQYDMTADDVLYGMSDSGSTKNEAACDELKRSLRQSEKPCAEIHRYFETMGIGKRTVDTAKKALSIESFKQQDRWYWRLP